MHQDPSELSHEMLSSILTGAFEMFSTYLREAWRRRAELDYVQQHELAVLVAAHDQFVEYVETNRDQLLTSDTPTMGQA